MDYAQGGTLWDVLDSRPHDGKIPEKDLRWWTPQVVSAIHWCHSQGFVHRDIKPHNFVLTSNAHILLIDFGSAAPLLPPDSDGVRRLPKKYCLVPCGTCDYISPEILQAHEEALIALEMDDEDDVVDATPKPRAEGATEGYGLETDWWSLGAMLYELAYGVAPFFANDIRQTYLKIINHEKSLTFDRKTQLSHEYQHFLSQLLTHAHLRLGRKHIMEITDHPVFGGVDWSSLRLVEAPPSLHLPQFTYTKLPSAPQAEPPALDESHSQGFAFSALFQSSPVSSASSGISLLQRSVSQAQASPDHSSFIGFSWGPPVDAFNHAEPEEVQHQNPPTNIQTPNPSLQVNQLTLPRIGRVDNTPAPNSYRFSTPIRYATMTPYGTLPRTGTIRRSAPRRNVSDREAMKQLVDCIGMSARKKVLESGKKPRVLTSFGRGGSSSRKELRFVSSPIPLPDYSAPSPPVGHSWKPPSPNLRGLQIDIPTSNANIALSSSEDTESEGPPSPSPRPGSAMSRRSGTPTVSSMASQRLSLVSLSVNGGNSLLHNPTISMDGNVELDPSPNNRDSNRRRAETHWSETHNHAQSVGRRRAMTVSSSAPSIYDDLEERHTMLMRNIGELEERLSNLTRLVKQR
ncbi:hypothetical protein AX15_005458 [Amanita polypyramis BW_CC]|nr:hypothetical protein AX15_005458 [Amanita polypyramis BW_CC]